MVTSGQFAGDKGPVISLRPDKAAAAAHTQAEYAKCVSVCLEVRELLWLSPGRTRTREGRHPPKVPELHPPPFRRLLHSEALFCALDRSQVTQ